MLLELHEDEVPDLDEPLVASVGGSAAVAEVGALVPEDLRTRPTGTRVRHPPVIVLVQALDALGRHAHLVTPDRLGLVVADMHGDPEAFGVQAQAVRHELPCVGAGLGLEVVAEAEVAHHLEEGEVAQGPTDLVQVVVLAAGPQALLHRHGPWPRGGLLAHEVGLERHHAGHREQQRGVMGQEVAGWLVVMPVGDEEVDEGTAQAVGGEEVFGNLA